MLTMSLVLELWKADHGTLLSGTPIRLLHVINLAGPQ